MWRTTIGALGSRRAGRRLSRSHRGRHPYRWSTPVMMGQVRIAHRAGNTAAAGNSNTACTRPRANGRSVHVGHCRACWPDLRCHTSPPNSPRHPQKLAECHSLRVAFACPQRPHTRVQLITHPAPRPLHRCRLISGHSGAVEIIDINGIDRLPHCVTSATAIGSYWSISPKRYGTHKRRAVSPNRFKCQERHALFMRLRCQPLGRAVNPLVGLPRSDTATSLCADRCQLCPAGAVRYVAGRRSERVCERS